jgi:hypothetical protein
MFDITSIEVADTTTVHLKDADGAKLYDGEPARHDHGLRPGQPAVRSRLGCPPGARGRAPQAQGRQGDVGRRAARGEHSSSWPIAPPGAARTLAPPERANARLFREAVQQPEGRLLVRPAQRGAGRLGQFYRELADGLTLFVRQQAWLWTAPQTGEAGARGQRPSHARGWMRSRRSAASRTCRTNPAPHRWSIASASIRLVRKTAGMDREPPSRGARIQRTWQQA